MREHDVSRRPWQRVRPRARSRIAGPAPTAGWARSRAGRGRCLRPRLVMSRYLPGV
jgi:hypothetical protein